LNRKQISTGYHSQAYPYFMRSNGPFKVYDHAQQKGQQYVYNLEESHADAHRRFQKECERIKEVREFEREQFGWVKHKEDVTAVHKMELRKRNNYENQAFLTEQMKMDKERKELVKEMDK